MRANSGNEEREHMKRGRLFLPVCVLLLMPYSASADLFLKDYRRVKSELPTRVYVGAVGDGFKWANVFLQHHERPRLYCPPSDLALRIENYIDILDREIVHRDRQIAESPNDSPIEMLLLLG